MTSYACGGYKYISLTIVNHEFCLNFLQIHMILYNSYADLKPYYLEYS